MTIACSVDDFANAVDARRAHGCSEYYRAGHHVRQMTPTEARIAAESEAARPTGSGSCVVCHGATQSTRHRYCIEHGVGARREGYGKRKGART